MKENKDLRKASSPACLSADENEALDMDQLMNVQGGTDTDTDTEPVRNCGLGCYLAGIGQTTQTGGDSKDGTHMQS